MRLCSVPWDWSQRPQDWQFVADNKGQLGSGRPPMAGLEISAGQGSPWERAEGGAAIPASRPGALWDR